MAKRISKQGGSKVGNFIQGSWPTKKSSTQIKREINEVLARKPRAYPIVRIDKSHIPAPVLVTALRNAELDPDGQIFPWHDGYPLVGQTVYADGALWSIWTKTRGAHEHEPGAVIKLVNEVTHEGSTKTRGEVRPVTWTQTDEDALAARTSYRPGRTT